MAIAERVILVHGTGATAENARGNAWWQDQGGLWSRLSEMTLEPDAFIWSGANNEKARRAASHDLFVLMKGQLGQGVKLHLLGHSHGGSVIWGALRLLSRHDKELSRGILSWTTVGTPFLVYGPRWGRLLRLILTAVASAAVIASGVEQLNDVDVALAWKTQTLLTLVWGFLFAVPVVALVLASLGIAPYIKRSFEAVRNRRLQFEIQRHLCLWSSQDEAIIGLGASGSFALKVLKETTGSGLFHWIGRLLHPVRTATNQFVNNSVSRALQGSTVQDIELKSAQPYPAYRTIQQPLPEPTDRMLIDAANEKSGEFGKRVRDILVAGRNPLTGFENLEKAAINAFSYRELVHTSYFLNADCRDLIFHHISRCSNSASPKQLSTLLNAWYESRFAHAVTKPATQTLPSNRVGYAVFAQCLAALLVLTLAAIALPVAYERTLAPTSAAYHLGFWVNEKLLAAALTAVPTPQEKSPLKWKQALLPLPASSSLLRNYIEAIVYAGELPLLRDAYERLESVALKQAFYRDAVPILGNIASEQDTRWLLNPENGLLPGPAHRGLPGAAAPEWPALYDFMERVFHRKNYLEKSDEELALALRLCGGNRPCEARLASIRSSRHIKAAPRYEPPPVIAVEALQSELALAASAKTFYGPSGFLELFSQSHWHFEEAAANRVEREQVMGQAFLKVICDAPSSYAGAAPDRKAIAAALNAIAPPAPPLSTRPKFHPELVAALEVLEGKRACEGQGTASEKDGQLNIHARAIAFEISKCIFMFMPDCGNLTETKDRINLIPDLAGLNSATRRRLHAPEIPAEEIGQYLFDDKEVLQLTSADAGNYQLVRRARFFKVALCLHEAREPELASKFAELGARSAILQRSYADPGELVETQISEAKFYGARLDWKKASETCLHCDPRRRVQIGTKLLGVFAEKGRKQTLCGRYTPQLDEMKELYGTQSEVETKLRNTASRF